MIMTYEEYMIKYTYERCMFEIGELWQNAASKVFNRAANIEDVANVNQDYQIFTGV